MALSDNDQNELQRAVGRMEGKLDAIIEELPLLAKRVTKLETWQNRLIGAGTVIGAASVFIFKLITARHQ